MRAIVCLLAVIYLLHDDELAAGLDHEQGHIARRHRFVMLLAVGLGQVLDRYSGTTRRAGAAFNALATVMVACTLLVAANLPAVAVSGAAADAHRGHHVHQCQH